MIKLVRIVFLLFVSAVAAIYLSGVVSRDWTPWLIMCGGVVASFGVITFDILIKKKNIGLISGVMFGILLGLLVSLGLRYLIDQMVRIMSGSNIETNTALVIEGIKDLLTLMICYLSVSFILQTKDDFRFIIPYVEFQRVAKGPRPIILDTSVIIDGRIADMAATGVFESSLILPRFVLNELQAIADSADRLKRARGRRGLEVLEKLKGLPRVEMRIWDGTLAQSAQLDEHGGGGVDQKLVLLALQESGRIMTNDYNLNKVAGLRGVPVININTIAESLKPVVLPGETMKVRIIKPGENSGQGVGYLEDGTMVVVEGGRDKVGGEVEVVVTNMIQNPAGKMIFGRVDGSSRTGDGSSRRGPAGEPIVAAASKEPAGKNA